MTEWFHAFSFDLMGEFAFGKSFDILETGQVHHAVRLLRRMMSLLGPMTPVPWLGQLALAFPVVQIARDWNSMVNWCGAQMEKKIEVSK